MACDFTCPWSLSRCARWRQARPGRSSRTRLRKPAGDLAAALIEKRKSWFDKAWVDTPNYDRARLPRGARVQGPAIIRQYDTTTVVLPGHFAEADAHGNLLIWPDSRGK